MTRFAIDDAYAASLPVQTVGADIHQELWIPAEQLDAFNGQIVGPIVVIGAHFGEGFRGLVPETGALGGKDAAAQIVARPGRAAFQK